MEGFFIVEYVLHYERCCVLWMMFSTVGDTISTVKDIQFCRGLPSVLRRIFITHRLFNTVEVVQYCRGFQQYYGGISSAMLGVSSD